MALCFANTAENTSLFRTRNRFDAETAPHRARSQVNLPYQMLTYSTNLRADSGLDGLIVETRTAPMTKPKWARAADDEVDFDLDAGKKQLTRATVEEECPECGHSELEFYTMQMRSVDEGQTVFYECLKCRHKFSQNN